MKLRRESAFIRGLAAGFLLLVLAACEDTDMTDISLPHVFGDNEVPADVAHEPRKVAIPAAGAIENATSPRLGDVPSKPKDFTPVPMIYQTMEEMETHRRAAEALKYDYENPVPQTPAP